MVILVERYLARFEFKMGLWRTSDIATAPGHLFTKRTDALPQDLVKSRSREIRVEIFSIALKFDRHLDSSTAEMPVKFQSDTSIIEPNLAASRLHEILRQDVRPLSE